MNNAKIFPCFDLYGQFNIIHNDQAISPLLPIRQDLNEMKLFSNVVKPIVAPKREPLVILHGLLGSHRNWQTISKGLSEQLGNKVISIDLRNHGKSVTLSPSPVGLPMNWSALVSDIKDTLEDKGPITLLGHSLGGQVAMQASLHNQLPIEKLIVVDISPAPLNFQSLQVSKYFEIMKQIDGLSREEAMQKFRSVEPDERVVQFIFTNYGKIGDGFGFLIPLKSLEQGMMELAKSWKFNSKIDIPTLFIKATKSNYITLEDEELISQTFSNFTIKEMKTGHWPHYEDPQNFIEIVKGFINC